jgi:hypothetical protein
MGTKLNYFRETRKKKRKKVGKTAHKYIGFAGGMTDMRNERNDNGALNTAKDLGHWENVCIFAEESEKGERQGSNHH